METPFGDGAVAGRIPTVGQWQIVAMSSSTPASFTNLPRKNCWRVDLAADAAEAEQ